MRNPRSILSACLTLSLAFSGCGNGTDGRDGEASTPEDQIVDVVTFDIDRINEEGLVGPPGGLRSVTYEFCVPADSISMAAVRAIDPTLELHPGAPGRIGCTDGQVLCIGHTLQPGWKATLARLAALDFVTRIDESFME
jgi:hypothetical protein